MSTKVNCVTPKELMFICELQNKLVCYKIFDPLELNQSINWTTQVHHNIESAK